MNDTTPSESMTDETSMTTPLTMDEVAKHNTPQDCWMVIEGTVYDVTPFIAAGMHPGGEAILEGCGIDATELFNTRPMGDNTPHSEKARGIAQEYALGPLEQ